MSVSGKKRAKDESTEKPKGRWKWTKRIGITLVALFVVYVLFGFFGVPWVAQTFVAPRISKSLSGELTMQRVSFNPFTLAVEIEGCAITDENAREVVGFDRFEGDLQLLDSLFNRGWWFGHARLYTPTVLAEIDENRAFNLASLIVLDPETEPLRQIPRIVVGDLLVSGASVNMRDLLFEPPIERSISDLEFVVTRLDTDPTYENPYELNALIGDDATVAWTGTAFIDPLTATGTLKVTGLDLTPFSPYAERTGDLDIEEGKLSFDVSYTIAPVSTGNRLIVDLHSASLNGLSAMHNGEPIIAVESIDLEAIKGDVDAGELSVDSVNIVGARATVRREEDGQLQLLRLATEGIERNTGDSGGATRSERRDLDSIEYPLQRLLTGLRYLTEDAQVQWTLSVNTVEISESSVRLIDRAVGEPVDVEFSEAFVSAGPATSTEGFRTPLKLSVRDPEGAVIEVEGVLDPGAGSVEAQVLIEQLGLGRYSVYVPRDLPGELEGIRLDSATVSLDGRIGATAGEETYTSVWDGAVKVAEFGARREGLGGTLAFESLDINGKLDARAPSDRSSVSGTWNGTVSITGVAGDAPVQGESSHVAVAGASAEGELRLEMNGSGVQIAWDGTSSVEGVDGQAPVQGEIANVAVGGANAEGGLRLTSSGSDVEVEWEGTAKAEKVAGEGRVRERAVTLVVEVADADGGLRLSTSNGALAVSWEGNAGVAGVEGAADGSPSASVQLDSGRLTESAFSWENQGSILAATSLELSGRDAQAVLEQLTDTAGESDGSRTSMSLAGLPVDLEINQIVLEQASYAIEDRTRAKTISLTGSELIAKIEEISSSGDAPARIDLTTHVIDVGIVTVKGTADVFAELLNVDLLITIEDLPLRPFSAVAEPQLGYAVASGRMRLELPVKIVDGQLDGDLDATLTSFELGDRVPSETATSLPVKLGVDLLKDPDGDLNLQVGLSGDTTDPSFRYDDMIWKAIFSLVGNVATAPFQVFASLVGAEEGVDLSRVEFEPGTADLAEGSVDKLDLLAEALKKRPGIRLSIIGVTGEEDGAALVGSVLDEMVRERMSGDSDEARETAIRSLYAERFPDDASSTIPVPPGRLSGSELTTEEMRGRLLRSLDVGSEQLAALGAERSVVVKSILVEQGGIAADRIAIASLEEARQVRDIEPSASVEFELLATD